MLMAFLLSWCYITDVEITFTSLGFESKGKHILENQKDFEEILLWPTGHQYVNYFHKRLFFGVIGNNLFAVIVFLRTRSLATTDNLTLQDGRLLEFFAFSNSSDKGGWFYSLQNGLLWNGTLKSSYHNISYLSLWNTPLIQADCWWFLISSKSLPVTADGITLYCT